MSEYFLRQDIVKTENICNDTFFESCEFTIIEDDSLIYPENMSILSTFKSPANSTMGEEYILPDLLKHNDEKCYVLAICNATSTTAVGTIDMTVESSLDTLKKDYLEKYELDLQSIKKHMTWRSWNESMQKEVEHGNEGSFDSYFKAYLAKHNLDPSVVNAAKAVSKWNAEVNQVNRTDVKSCQRKGCLGTKVVLRKCKRSFSRATGDLWRKVKRSIRSLKK